MKYLVILALLFGGCTYTKDTFKCECDCDGIGTLKCSSNENGVSVAN